jgi:predicted DNA-binding ribbon-helix-helix protein
MNENHSNDGSLKKTIINNFRGVTMANDEKNPDKGIKFKLSSKENVDKKENEEENIENNGNNENNEKGKEIIEDDLQVNANKKKSFKEVKSTAPSSILTQASMETAIFNKLKNGIIENRETSTVRLMKYLTFIYGLVTIAFIIYDSFRNKNNLNEMGEYLKENLYFNHSKIAVASLYFAGLNLKWLKDGHITNKSCPNENCQKFYTELLVQAIDDVKTQKENFSSFYEDFRDILKQEQIMELVLYNLNYTDKIRIDTDNLLNLLVFNGLKLKAGLTIYFNGTKNGVYDIASSNLLSQSINYIYSNISSFKSNQKEVKVHDNFKLLPVSLICISIIFITLIIGFIYLVYKIHLTEIYFLEKLINFNTVNFDAYLKILDELKKRLRNENAEEESKDEDMEFDSNRISKKEEEEKIEIKKKLNEDKNEQKKKKKKAKKSNKLQQQKKKKKHVMGLYFFK